MPENSEPTTPSGVALGERVYAGWPVRALGFFLDFLPALILTTIAQMYFYSSTTVVTRTFSDGPDYQVFETHGPGFTFYLLYLIAILYWFSNKGYLEGTTGRSLAKRLLGCSTVDEATNQPIGVGFGVLRAFLVYLELILIAVCGLGLILWLWPLWDAKRQAILSDRTVRAVVYKD
ncbi:MAG: RDD family protein [Candidatus Nanopelagicales bacterium]